MHRAVQFCSLRNHAYYWRRRIPSSRAYVDFSLGTRDWRVAQQLSCVLTLESERAFGSLREGNMTEEQVKAFMKLCFKKHQDKLRNLTMLALDSGDSIQEEITANRVAAHAHFALAQGGLDAQAAPTGDTEFDRRVSKLADATADMIWSEAGTERMRHQISDFLGTQATGIELATGRMAKLNAMAAAALSVADELASRTGTSQLEQSRELVALLEQPDVSNIPAAAIDGPRAPSQTTMTQQGIDEHNSMQGAELDGTLEFARDMVARAVRTGAHDAAWGKVKLRVIEEFVECTGCTTLVSIRQADIWKWMRILEQLPAAHGKDPIDAERTLHQRVENAQKAGKAGFKTIGAKTIKKNLSVLGSLLKAAKNAGFSELGNLSTAIQDRSVHIGATRTDRPRFKTADLFALFAGPIWTGCKSQSRRNLPGDLIIQDGLYWCPLIAAYTGVRREEIAGMQVADVDILAQTPAFVVRVNSNRGLKTIASARTIPIPAPILKLGFAKYVTERQQRRDVDLFPELAARAGIAKGTHSSFGDKMDHHFNNAVDLALGANREVDGRRKTFHSFRHYVATKLDNHDAVRDKTVQDLLGHENVGTTNRIYRDPTPLPIMLDAIEKLPDFTIAAQAALSHARVAAPRPRNKKRTRTAQNTACAN
ncbi:hypothetical protein C4375_00160 [Devosia sp. I507]|nr:hypothetical protein C4375_00160 [Devosia sp. I507]